MIFDRIKNEGFEQIVFCHDQETGLKAIISMHSTVLGPGVGGCRMWNYPSELEALEDVLRLSRGMTYKASISNLNWGGGKAVILGDAKKDKNPRMLARFGEYVDRLGGNYVTAKDVGIGGEDLKVVKTKTKHVLGIEGVEGSSGDPSPATSWGIYHGMKAAAKAQFGSDSLEGKVISVQGLGSVAYYLIENLVKEGAKVIGCDVDQNCIDRAIKDFKIETVSPEKIYDVDADIFAPCALGSILNEKTIPRLKVKVVAGGANNQLATDLDGKRLIEKGILYSPDYAINAGGLINIYHESMVQGGYNKKAAFDHVAEIGETMALIFDRSKKEGRPTHEVADRIAEERVENAR